MGLGIGIGLGLAQVRRVSIWRRIAMVSIAVALTLAVRWLTPLPPAVVALLHARVHVRWLTPLLHALLHGGVRPVAPDLHLVRARVRVRVGVGVGVGLRVGLSTLLLG